MLGQLLLGRRKDPQCGGILTAGHMPDPIQFAGVRVSPLPGQSAGQGGFLQLRLQQQYPELLIAFGTLHPDFPDCAGEIRRIRELGLHGLKFHPDFQQFHIDDPCMDKIYEAVGGTLPLLFHTGDSRTQFSKPERLLNVHKKYPDLKLIAAHLGGYSEWDRAMRYLVGQDIWLDTSSSIRFIGPQEARKLVEAHGTDRVLFASDYPGDTQRQAVKEVLSMGLSAEDNEKIFCRNAERLLGIRV